MCIALMLTFRCHMMTALISSTSQLTYNETAPAWRDFPGYAKIFSPMSAARPHSLVPIPILQLLYLALLFRGHNFPLSGPTMHTMVRWDSSLIGEYGHT